jgi:hypothetical protein
MNTPVVLGINFFKQNQVELFINERILRKHLLDGKIDFSIDDAAGPRTANFSDLTCRVETDTYHVDSCAVKFVWSKSVPEIPYGCKVLFESKRADSNLIECTV